MKNQIEKLDQPLLEWQDQKRQEYQKLNKKENPQIIFVGDSIIDFFPIKKLIQTDLEIANRGIAGYISDLIIDYFPIHIFGEELKQVYLLIGTNDLGMRIEIDEILENIKFFIKKVQGIYPNVKLTILSVLPVNEGDDYAARVKIRNNTSIKELNITYRDLVKDFENVDFLNVGDVLKDQEGQLQPQYTNDGLHLTSGAYELISDIVNEHLKREF